MPESSTADCPMNYSSGETSQQYEIGYTIYYSTSILLIAIVCLTGNTLVIKFIGSSSRIHMSACSYMILSLACSDISMAVTYPIYNVFQILDSGTASEERCKWVIFFVCVPQTISSYSLVGLTVVRFLAVLKPHTYQQWLFIPCYRRTLLGCIVCIWTWALLVSFILYVVLYDPEEHIGNKCRYEMIYDFHHAIYGFCVVTLMSVITMVTVYIAIVYVYKKQTRSIGSRQSTNNRVRAAKTEANLGQSAGILVGTYVITWFPVWIYVLVYTVCFDKHSDCPEYCEQHELPFLRASVNILGFANSAVNIFIYSGTNAKFRQAVKKDLLKICHCLSTCKRLYKLKGRPSNTDSNTAGSRPSEKTTTCVQI